MSDAQLHKPRSSKGLAPDFISCSTRACNIILFAPADLKSNLTLSFQKVLCSPKHGLTLATKSLMSKIVFSLSLSNFYPGVDRSRHDLLQIAWNLKE